MTFSHVKSHFNSFTPSRSEKANKKMTIIKKHTDPLGLRNGDLLKIQIVDKQRLLQSVL